MPIVEDRRIWNRIRYVVTDNALELMLIPEEMRKCVGFIGIDDPSNPDQQKYIGTVFFLARPAIRNSTHVYAVTAKHLIDRFVDQVDSIYIRLNRKDGGSEIVKTKVSNWMFHPTDSTVDVAVMKFAWPPHCDHISFPLNSIPDSHVGEWSYVGIGSDVFVTGLFDRHLGQNRNTPIVRIGNVAARPEEKVPTKNYGLIDAYLIEVRSIGGLSGSPVFVQMGTVESTKTREVVTTFYANGTSIDTPLPVSNQFGSQPVFYLLGLMHGHFGTDRPNVDSVILTDDQINSGIGIVVPSTKILEVIQQPKMLSIDAKQEENLVSHEGSWTIED